MSKQNYENHKRFVIGYHVLTFLAIGVFIIGSIRGFIKSSEENLYSSSLLVLVGFILFMLYFYLRIFALKAQDRGIVAEERLRYFILTGKAINNKLTVRQIIGLRFAGDDEFVELANRAIAENLSENEIKKLVKNWKEDNYRV